MKPETLLEQEALPGPVERREDITACDVQTLRFWSLERAVKTDSYLLGLATETRGKQVFHLRAADILRLAQLVLEDRDLPAPAIPLQ